MGLSIDAWDSEFLAKDDLADDTEYGKRGLKWLRTLSRGKIIIGCFVTAALVDRAIRGDDGLVGRSLEWLIDVATVIMLKIISILAILTGVPYVMWKLFNWQIRRSLVALEINDTE